MASPTLKPQSYIGHILVIVSTLIYSFNTNFMKMLTPEWIGVYGLVLFRTLVSVVAFWIIGLFFREPKGNEPSRKDIMIMMASGLFGIAINLLFYVKGISMTTPIDSFVIRSTQPIIVIGLSILLFNKKPTIYKIIGIILGMGGVVYISMQHHVHVKEAHAMLGNLFVFLASIASGIYLIMIQPCSIKYNTITVMKWMSLSAFIVTLPIGAKELINAPVITGSADWKVWFELLFVLIMANMVSYFLSVKALSYISPLKESAYIYMLPITGGIVAIALGLQTFSWHYPISFVFIVLGFIFINKKKPVKNNKPEKEEPMSAVPTSHV